MAEPSQILNLKEANFQILIEINPEGQVFLLHCAATPFEISSIGNEATRHLYRLVEVQLSGENRDDHHDVKHIGTQPGNRLRYVSHSQKSNTFGQLFTLLQRDPITGLEVTTFFQFFTSLAILRAWTTLLNAGTQQLGVEYVSSFALTGLTKETKGFWEDLTLLHVPHNTWCEELQWRSYRLPELGLTQLTRWPLHSVASLKRLSFQSLGTWSTAQYLPMGIIENTVTGSAVGWQIESNGGWHWELSDLGNQLYVRLSGPTDQEHQWWKSLAPGESFESVRVAIAAVAANSVADVDAAGRVETGLSALDKILGSLTSYRRQIRRPNADNENLPIVFNDYMNALNGDPTSAKELPLIQAAAAAGCEVYCIDAGWYAELGASWWDTVGEWQPSQTRFPGPNGLVKLLQSIREYGMVAGLWLELEVIGINSPLAQVFTDDWFFCRHGKRVIDHGRYQLDFRNPAVRAYASSVVDRLVQDYGVGYIKMDYNINAGIGTDLATDSAGDGLLEHTRAYLGWLDRIFDRYPQLVIENCGSGGMRMDYAFLQRHSIQLPATRWIIVVPPLL